MGGGLLCVKIDHAQVRATVETGVGVEDRMPGASKGHSYGIAVSLDGSKVRHDKHRKPAFDVVSQHRHHRVFRVIDDSPSKPSG